MKKTTTIKRMNKKAMMDDLFDFLFTVFLAFFILLFIGVVLSGGQKAKNEETLNQINKYNIVSEKIVENNIKIINNYETIKKEELNKEIEKELLINKLKGTNYFD